MLASFDPRNYGNWRGSLPQETVNALPPPPLSLAPAVINLSQETIPSNLLELLEKGGKFVIRPVEKHNKIKHTLLTDLAVGRGVTAV